MEFRLIHHQISLPPYLLPVLYPHYRFQNVQWPDNHGWYTCRCYAENATSVTSIEAMAYLHVQGNKL